MKTQIKQTIAKLSALAFVLSLAVGVAPQSEALTDAEEEVTINATVQASLQLAVDSGAVVIEVDPDVDAGQNWSGTGAVDGTSQTVTTVNTNDLQGYKLQVKLEGTEVPTVAQLDGMGSGNTATIQSGNARATGTGGDNLFGYSLNDNDASAVATFGLFSSDIANSEYHSPTNSHQQTIYYHLNVDYTTPADTYSGKVTYTALTL